MYRKLITLGLISALAGVIAINQTYKTQRSGTLTAPQLQQQVVVDFDQYGVPHIQADNLEDMYFALGYVHAQDRLFQMETMRRLAQGQLAEVFGEELLETDKLFRTLGIASHAREYVAKADKSTAAWRAFESYLAGVNHFQDTGKLPIEFDILGIETRPFHTQDSISVAGYMAYSFAVAMRTEPLMTYISEHLGEEHLQLFALDKPASPQQTHRETLASLAPVAKLSLLPQSHAQFEGSNAWAISGSRTASGKPILESDPHISFGMPGTWYEAHLQAGDFELYGHHLPLVPPAMLGHNRQFGWGITMFQNDDIDFYVERSNPDNPNQVWVNDRWEALQSRQETIEVKDADSVTLEVRSSRHGPIINDIFPGYDAQPVAMWWTFHHSDNPMLEAFYGMNHASSIEDFAKSVEGIHSPGLNIMYADADNNIGWWAAARIPMRPAHVKPWHLLDGASGKDSPQGFYDFRFNPQQVNPERGYIVSANHRPKPQQGLMTPGYYNFDARAEKITQALEQTNTATLENQQPVQLDTASDHAKRALTVLLNQQGLDMDPLMETELRQWDGNFSHDSIAATVFTEWQYQLAHLAFADELGEERFELMKNTRKIDFGFYNLVRDAASPWWNHTDNDQLNGMADIVRQSWLNTKESLQSELGQNWHQWRWHRVHTLELQHAFSVWPLLRPLFNLGPVAVEGSHAVPNNLSQKFSSGTQQVTSGPSTRRLIDFAKPEESLGILPAGQSGNPLDPHYDDQFEAYTLGQYRQQILNLEDIQDRQTLTLLPKHP